MGNEFDVDWEKLAATYAKGGDADAMGNYLMAADEDRRIEAAVETRLSGRSLQGGGFESMRALTDSEQAKGAVALPIKAGTRVTFRANAGSMLAYQDPPAPNDEGVVTNVKSASGDITDHEGMVFVRWSDGNLRAVHAEHLRLAKGKQRRSVAASASSRIRVASLGDLTDFLKVAEDTLVHKATRDLWAVRQDGSEFVIERLFKDDGGPLKV